MCGIGKGERRGTQPLVLAGALLACVLLTSACAPPVEGASILEGLLPEGQRPNWYWERMESSGYQVTAVNYQQNDHVNYQVVKGTGSYEVRLALDPRSGAAASVTIVEHGTAPKLTGVSLESERVEKAEVPAGTRIATRLAHYLDSGANQKGDTFSMNVAEPVSVDDRVVIPVGARIQGYVESSEAAHRPNKGGRLVLKPSSIELSGAAFEVEGIVTAEVGEEGEPSLRQDVEEIAGGAGIGGLVGGLLGGGKGVLAGVLIGGGGTFIATKGEQIELSPDTELIVELLAPLRLPVSSGR